MKPTLLLPFALALIFATSNAQWKQMNGPYTGEIISVAEKDSIVIASIFNYGGNVAFISYNNGQSWKTITAGTGLPINANSFVISGTDIFAAGGSSGGGVYLSTDSGNTWSAVNNGLPNQTVTSLVLSGTDIFAGIDGGGVFFSANSGSSWTAVNNGLTNQSVLALAINGANIFAGTDKGGIFLSSNYGTNWTAVNTGLTDSVFQSLTISGQNIFAGSRHDGVFLSTNNGNSWTWAGLSGKISSLATSGSDVFAGKNNGMHLSSDTGNTWTTINAGLPANHAISSLAISGTNIYAGTPVGLYLSGNNGNNWNITGCPTLRINTFAKMGTVLLSGGYNNNGGLQGGIFLSTDSGINWSIKNNGLPSIGLDIRTLAVSGSQVFAGIFRSGIFTSTDTGNTWVAANNGITNNFVESIVVSGTKLFAGCDSFGTSAVFLSTDNGITWSDLQYPNAGLSELAIVGTNLFASGPEILMLPDTGSTWIPKNNGLPSTFINAVFYEGNKLFASPMGDGVYMSLDTGNTWAQLNNGLPIQNSYIICGASDGFNYFLGAYLASQDSLGVYISTDNCSSWIKINDGLLSKPWITSLMVNGNDILAGTFASVFRRSISEILTTLSIDEIEHVNSDFSIYPNPTKNSFIIQLNSKIMKGLVEIFNVFGENVYRENIFNSSFKNIHLKNVSSGIYFVKVFDGEKQLCKKIIVEHD